MQTIEAPHDQVLAENAKGLVKPAFNLAFDQLLQRMTHPSKENDAISLSGADLLDRLTHRQPDEKR